MTNTFLSCDWGTTSFRLRLVDSATQQVLAEKKNNDGIAEMYRKWTTAGAIESRRISFYQQHLCEAIKAIEQQMENDLAGTTIVISGMASSTIGMLPLPYAPLPFSVKGQGLIYHHLQSSDSFPFPVFLISGVQSETDIMRGEETQLIGCTNETEPSGRQWFIFPGTHSKHILVQDSRAIAFSTYLTGELFQLLGNYSILQHAVDAGGTLKNKKNKRCFCDGVSHSSKQNLLHQLFAIRAASVLAQRTPQENYFYLSGLLIGTELKDIQKQSFDRIVLCSNTTLQPLYQLVFSTLNISNVVVSPFSIDEATIRGQAIIYQMHFNLNEHVFLETI